VTGADAPHVAAERIDRLLAELSAADPRAAAAAEELTRCLVQLYGTGLARIVGVVGAERSLELCADPLVESLLLVHDLHPLDADARIRRALRTYPGELEYRGIDAAGVVHLRLTGGGCGSARRTTVDRIEAIVRQAAPEIAGIDVDTPPPALPLLQVSRRPDTFVQPPSSARSPAVADAVPRPAVADAVPEGAAS
jgi:Fe-S cluster biogenesis protein NfuA